MDDLLETTRNLEGQEDKRDKADFALWKAAAPEHIMRWRSPWGVGFPGWHIECSAMATKYLGAQFDIHGGGMDLLFPHHESEIAQSTICNHTTPVRYWIHNNMITINGRKMGKSYNNVIKLTELFNGSHPMLEKAYSPMTVRFFILQTHYRGTLDFSNEALQASEKGFQRLMDGYDNLKSLIRDENNNKPIDKDLDTGIKNICDFPYKDLNDDFNTAKALSHLMTAINLINGFKYGVRNVNEISSSTLLKLKKTFKEIIEDILGLKKEYPNDLIEKLNGTIETLIDLRAKFKEEKDYISSDLIRIMLENLGVSLKDDKTGETDFEIIENNNSIRIDLKTDDNLQKNDDLLFDFVRLFEGKVDRLFIKNNSKIDIGENELSEFEFINLFRGKRTQTWIGVSSNRIICVIYSLENFIFEIRWQILKDQIIDSDSNIKIELLFDRNYSPKIGLVDFGKKHKGWKYSKDIIKPEEFNSLFKSLVTKKFIDKS